MNGNENCVALQHLTNLVLTRIVLKKYIVCYKKKRNLVLVKENKTWDEALVHCREQHTASLISETEQLQAQQNLSQALTNQVWTGLRFLVGRRLWVNGDSLEYLARTGGELPLCPAPHLRCGTLSKVGEYCGTWRG